MNKLLVLIFAVTALFATSCSSDSSNSLFGGSEKGNFRDTLKINDFKVNFEVQDSSQIKSNETIVSSAAQGGTYVIVYCDVTNAGTAPQKPFDITVKLLDPNATEYMWDLGATTALQTTSKSITTKQLSDINPGITITTAYVFEVSTALLQQKGWKIKFEMEKEKFILDIALKNPPTNKPAEMVLVAGGTFKMGDISDAPIHSVTLDSFYIGKYEVTNTEYNSIMGDYFTSINYDNSKKNEKLPVVNISWFQAVEFCNAKSAAEGLTPCYTIKGEEVRCNFKSNGYRLPTAAEWEFAARGGNLSKGFSYSGSNNIGEVAWYDKNSGETTHIVGTKTPNELGLYDMSGNVVEWNWDWHAGYSASAQTNPTGAISGTGRVLRGGSYNFNDDRGFRVSIRLLNDPYGGCNSLGFRLARTY